MPPIYKTKSDKNRFGNNSHQVPDRCYEVEMISKVKEVSFTDEWYEIAVESHFWMEWRLTAMLKQIKKLNILLDQELKVLEVGCGTGLLRAEIESVTRWVIDGADLNMNALSRTKRCRGRTMYYNIYDEHDAFLEAYDIVILFDVLEHIKETKPFLTSVLRHIKPGGNLLLNVPALQTFYSAYDAIMGHMRRYNRKTLAEEFINFSFEIEDMRYWGMSLLCLLSLRVFMMILARRSNINIVRLGFSPHSIVINKLLRSVMRIETTLCSNPPIGASLLMVGRKL